MSNLTKVKTHPALQKLRKERGIALRLMLRQIRTCGGTWSNGHDVFSGARLDELRVNSVHRLINLRSEMKEPDMGRMTRNMMRAPGDLGFKNIPDGVSLDDFLLRILDRHTRSDDTGTRERRLVATRFLRARHPDHYNNLPLRIRCTAKELSFVVAAMNAKEMVLTRDHKDSSGVIFPQGSEVSVDSDGNIRAHCGSHKSCTTIHIANIRKPRKISTRLAQDSDACPEP